MARRFGRQPYMPRYYDVDPHPPCPEATTYTRLAEGAYRRGDRNGVVYWKKRAREVCEGKARERES